MKKFAVLFLAAVTGVHLLFAASDDLGSVGATFVKYRPFMLLLIPCKLVRHYILHR